LGTKLTFRHFARYGKQTPSKLGLAGFFVASRTRVRRQRPMLRYIAVTFLRFFGRACPVRPFPRAALLISKGHFVYAFACGRGIFRTACTFAPVLAGQA
jgi:hypothetical protein